MPDRLTEIKARQATWPALPDFREHAMGDLTWAVAEIEDLAASLLWIRRRNAEIEAALLEIKQAAITVAPGWVAPREADEVYRRLNAAIDAADDLLA